MCGIAGIIGTLSPGTLDALRRTIGSMSHRGPDGDGFLVCAGAQQGTGAALAHRRLAIIDLSDDGRQPMTDPATGNSISFNGEIYNYQELRAELARLGHRFRTRTDTEVILKAYAQWGGACVERLRGMFAFTIWDVRLGVAFLARDRLGIKPFYWAVVNAGDGRPAILFASEVRAMLASGLVPRLIDQHGMASYLWNGFVIGPDSMVRNVRLLPAGTTAVVRPDSLHVDPKVYWRIPVTPGQETDPSRVQESLRTAVKQHLVGDVPVGVFLSGGIDSSAMAAMAAAESPHIQTYNVSFGEAGFDEAPYARRVAGALGTDHHEFRLTEEIFKAQLGDALDGIDQPTFDAINTYFVSRIVREAGAKVALAGTGGDELFGGYSSFAELPRLRRASRIGSMVPAGIVRSAARLKTGRPGAVGPQARWGKLSDAMSAGGRMLELYQVGYGLFTSEFLAELNAKGCSGGAMRHGMSAQRAGELTSMIANGTDLTAISALELSCFLGERLLRDTDAASMAVSLEVRVPLLDHEFIESVAMLDGRTRYAPVRSKRLLRELALGGLDPSTFDRPKSGFVLPLEVWCKAGLGDLVADTLLDADRCTSVGLEPAAVARLWAAFQAGAPGIYWSRVWALFIVLWWSRRHGMSM